jgi:hypothetical protein
MNSDSCFSSVLSIHSVCENLRNLRGLLPAGPTGTRLSATLEKAESELKFVAGGIAHEIRLPSCPQCRPPELMIRQIDGRMCCRRCGHAEIAIVPEHNKTEPHLNARSEMDADGIRVVVQSIARVRDSLDEARRAIPRFASSGQLKRALADGSSDLQMVADTLARDFGIESRESDLGMLGIDPITFQDAGRPFARKFGTRLRSAERM